MTANTENNNQETPKSLGNPEFRKEFKKFCNQKKVDNNKKNEWSHKQQCLKHAIVPIVNKYFDLPSKLTNFCSCPKTKVMVRNNYTKTHRVSLLNALKSYNYKSKAAKLGINLLSIISSFIFKSYHLQITHFHFPFTSTYLTPSHLSQINLFIHVQFWRQIQFEINDE